MTASIPEPAPAEGRGASAVQAQFFLAGQLHPAPGLNTITRAVLIDGPLSVEGLKAAFATLVGRHPSLQTTLKVDGGQITQRLRAASFELKVDAAPATDDALSDAADALRARLSPEALTWSAVLLEHAPERHTLLFAAHRCVFDEASTAMLAADLGALYRAQRSHQPEPALPNGSVAWLDGDAAAGARHFAQTLADAPPLLAFPSVVARPKVLQVETARSEKRYPPELTKILRERATQWGLTGLEVQVAAVAYLLAQYASQERVGLGLPFALTTGARGLGSLTAMLPLGLSAEAASFEALARDVAARYQAARPFGATPFHEIAKAAAARGDTSANVLFQAACVEVAPLALELDGCRCSERAVAPPPQQLDLFIHLGPEGLAVDYLTQLISSEMAEAFCRSMVAFLSAALNAPAEPLSKLPLVDAETREQLLLDAKTTRQPDFLQHDLFALLSRHFEKAAAKKALVCNGKNLTYAQLSSSADAVARALNAAGLKQGALVGVCLPRSVEMVAAMLGVLKAGCAYVPLDPAFPKQRLGYMVEHSKLTHLLTTPALKALFDGANVQVVEVQPDAAPSEPLAAATARADAAAYVIYTSGSTGKPKGVAVPRGAVANFLLSMQERPGLKANDTLCAVTTLSFDIAVLELLAPLVAGGTVVIATEEEARDPRLLSGLLQTHRVTMLQATPVTWQMLLSSQWSGDKQLVALCGGEAMPPTLAQALLPRVAALWNMYGPTETTVWSTCHQVEDAGRAISVGTPIHNTTLHILDGHGRLLPSGVEGRLVIGGAGVALGYLHNEPLTKERFVPDPFAGTGRLYDTGDKARRDRNGLTYVVGRSDFQVKLRGFRIELGEIEAQLASFSPIAEVVCVVRRDDPQNPELAAYYTLKNDAAEPGVTELRAHCSTALPTHMVPSRFVRLESLPRTLNGKVDRGALPAPGQAGPAAPKASGAAVKGAVERTLFEIFTSVLSIPQAGAHDNFFELGGTSLAAFAVAQQVSAKLGIDISVLRVFEHPTIATLAKHLEGSQASAAPIRDAFDRAKKRRGDRKDRSFDVAIIGMAGRFPGAKNLDELWANLAAGKETVTTFSRDELDPLVPAHDRADKAYVPSRGVLENIDQFDAAFFGISPNEAELMDPQLRVFMEVAWEAFENAGYVGEDVKGLVGAWAGMGNNFYYLYNVLTRPDKLAVMGDIAAEVANEKDHIAPRISHRFNLSGPSLSVHTACSTTLVVLENAYQALITNQVDLALAGGVDIRTPQKSGQHYEDGGVFSIDGHCRPFDAAATGTMFGEGAGAVILKRLDDAIADGDTIHAVLKGAAVNHDGGHKAGYLAPSVEGQARVIATALALGDVHPDTITMVEAHGTATPIGDPIEVEALTRVYRLFTQRRNYCAIGSIKGNFGHATTAAGIAGVFKAVLSMKHRQIPPTLHFSKPNPQIDFDSSPFFVADKLLDWAPAGVPRRATVSSFGFCGTNAHVVLEEAPATAPSSAPSRPAQLVLMSARSPKALDALAHSYVTALEDKSTTELADFAFTTQVGRKRHEYRRVAVLTDSAQGPALTEAAGASSASVHSESRRPPLAFMFPGQGSQYVNMGLRLYQREPVFKESIDACCQTLEPHLGVDLRTYLFPPAEDAAKAQQSLNNTFYTQPAIYTVSYSLATLFKHWGLEPDTFVGHSIGEFVAATLAGVMERDDALRLVAARGRLMQSLPGGSMLSVRLPADKVVGRLPPGVDLAAVNSPQLCVVAGPKEAIAAFAEQLTKEGAAARTLHTSHAFHSSMMDPVVEPFLREVEKTRLVAPRVPFVSTVLGDWISPQEACSPHYWAKHLRSPVMFSKALTILLEDKKRVFLELGPRRTSAMLALQHRPQNPDRIIASMPDGGESDDEYNSLLLALGSLWMQGCDVDWAAFHEGERRRRVGLPTYAFQRKRYWIEPGNTESFGLGRSPPRAEVAKASAVVPEAAAVPEGRLKGDEITRQVFVLLEELLGFELDNPDENARFIALGLDSLLVTQLARAVRARLGFEVTFRQLTEKYSTTKLLADAIRATRPAVAAAPPPPAPVPVQKTNGATAPESPAPAAPVAPPVTALPPPEKMELASTPAQLEMWLSELAGPEASCAYNEQFAITLEGQLNDAALERALQGLSTLHPALRGHFSDDGERFIIESTVEVPVARHDLSDLPEDQKAEQQRAIIEASARTPYKLEVGPLYRAAILKHAENKRVVLLGAHHSIADGWSLDVMLMDFARLYSAQVKTAPVGPPRHTFKDWVELRQTPAYQKQIASSRAFFKKQFEKLPPPLELPADGRRPPVRSYGANHAIHLGSPELLEAMKAFARAEGLSLFAVLFSSLAALLHRLSGATDLVVGIPVASHPEAGLEEAVGHLVNLVPVRARVDPAQTFRQLCHATSAAILDAREHAAVSFGEIVADANVPRDPARVPLVPIIFTHVQKYAPGKLEFAGSSVSYRLAPRAFETFELNLTVVESHDSLEVKMHGNSDLFSRQWLDWRTQELAKLLRNGCAAPDTKVAQVDLLPEPESSLLEQFNRTAAEFPRGATMVDVFEAQARKSPEAIALRFGEAGATYRQLDARANQLAHLLRARGVGRGTLVGLCLQRSIDMVASLLAVMKAGGGYLPLDPGFPAARLAFMVEDSAAKWVVSESSLAAHHGAGADKTLALDQVRAELERASSEPLQKDERSAQPEDLAYVLYTSGSTGKPKGVMVPQRAAVNLLTSMAKEPGLRASDRLLAVTTLSFDIALAELVLPLTVGAEVVIASREQAMDGEVLQRLLAEHRITAMQATPVTWRMLCDSGWKGSPGLLAIVGGEALQGDLAEMLLERVGTLWNMYGPTETTVWSTACRITEKSKISIGRPIANTSVWILDSAGQVCPLGVPGEIVIGGAGVAKGYLNRPELTHERFVPDRFASAPGATMYRTGDLGRWRSDGLIDCLGRTDFQVKVRGYRIELGEIETRLGEHPSIREACVMVREVDRQPAIVAYLLWRPGANVSHAELRAHLRRSLPDYMVPGVFVELQAFPRTDNNKVDRKALPAPPAADAAKRDGARNGADELPRTETEKLVAETWSQLLRVPQPKRTDNFFDLGGASLIAVQMSRRLKHHTGVELPLSVLLETANLAEYAARLEALRSARRAAAPGAYEHLVTIRQGAAHRLPFFCVAGAGGNVLNLRSLAFGLDDGQPFIGIQLRGVDGREPHQSVEEMAEAYLSEVKRRQPRGPYLLGGYSGGGFVAYEMARRLTNGGEEVAFLALFDAWSPLMVAKGPNVVNRLARLRDEGLRYLPKLIERRKFRADEKRQHDYVRGLIRDHAPIPADLRELWLYLKVGEVLGRYQPRPWNGRATLYRATTNYSYSGGGRAFGWDQLMAGGVEVVTVPGDHSDLMLPPHVDELARKFARSLEEVLVRLAPSTWQAAPADAAPVRAAR